MNIQEQNPKLLRLDAVLSIFPISKSAWWAGVKTGKYPASVKLGAHTTAWRAQDIYKLIESFKPADEQAKENKVTK